jgi:hypothetical protein
MKTSNFQALTLSTQSTEALALKLKFDCLKQENALSMHPEFAADLS